MGSPPGDITASIWAEVAELVDPLSDDVREDIEQYQGEVADILERDGWPQPDLVPVVTNTEGRPAFRNYTYLQKFFDSKIMNPGTNMGRMSWLND